MMDIAGDAASMATDTINSAAFGINLFIEIESIVQIQTFFSFVFAVCIMLFVYIQMHPIMLPKEL